MLRHRRDRVIGEGMIETSTATDKRHRFPAQLIAYAVWLYVRFPLSPA